MRIIDTHCHIQDDEYDFDIDSVLERALLAGVEKMICIGTDYRTSKLAVAMANKYDNIYAVIGIHPHESNKQNQDIESLIGSKKIVGVGEIGLDYFYMHSSKESQIASLKLQLEIASKYNLPVVFHVREAYEDFWPIYDEHVKKYPDFKGEIHSFTDNQDNLDEALRRGLYIGVNGISTFTKDEYQKKVFSSIPIDSLLLETDSPFLTPAPFRGKMNEPSYCMEIAIFWSNLLGVTLEELTEKTYSNATKLFKL
jgi:TatD DNase family protein